MDRLSVAIIGNGVVGQATKRVIDKYHSVQMHDPLQNLVCDYELSDVVFICTPSECVKEYLAKLEGHPFVYVRSTIPFHLVQNTNFAVWPEFLTERTAVHDSLNPTHNVVGGNAQQVDKLCETTIFTTQRQRMNAKQLECPNIYTEEEQKDYDEQAGLITDQIESLGLSTHLSVQYPLQSSLFQGLGYDAYTLFQQRDYNGLLELHMRFYSEPKLFLRAEF